MPASCGEAYFALANEMTAFARTPVLAEATPLGALLIQVLISRANICGSRRCAASAQPEESSIQTNDRRALDESALHLVAASRTSAAARGHPHRPNDFVFSTAESGPTNRVFQDVRSGRWRGSILIRDANNISHLRETCGIRFSGLTGHAARTRSFPSISTTMSVDAPRGRLPPAYHALPLAEARRHLVERRAPAGSLTVAHPNRATDIIPLFPPNSSGCIRNRTSREVEAAIGVSHGEHAMSIGARSSASCAAVKATAAS
jgi:hypothetical protein